MNTEQDYCILNPEEYTKTSEIIINSYDDIDIPISSKCGGLSKKTKKTTKKHIDDNSKINQFDKAVSTKQHSKRKFKKYKPIQFSHHRPLWTPPKDPDLSIINQSKMAQVTNRPSQYYQDLSKQPQSILNCKQNNLSKTCPDLRCHVNIDKPFYFPVDRVVMNIGNKKVFESYRAPSQICYKYSKEPNNKKLQNMNLKDDRYFKNVNVENDLLNLQYPHGCSVERVIDTSGFSKDDGGFQNVQSFNYNLANTTSIKNRHPILKCQNIESKNYCPKNLQTSTTNLQHPVANYQMNEVAKSIQCQNFLPIGPVRNDRPHCETDWDNITRPKSIRRPRKKYPVY